MLSRDEHDDIVGRLYRAATGELRWPDTIQHVAGLFGQSAGVVQVNDSAWNIACVENHGYSREFAERFYASEPYLNDPRVPHFAGVRPGQFYFDHCLYDVAEMDRNPWVRESCDILGVKYQLGAVVEPAPGMIGYFTLMSTEAEGHADAAAIAAFRRLGPHIQQAYALGHLFEYRAATHAALLEALAVKADGVMLLDRKGLPSFANDAARAVLACADGLALAADGFVTCRAQETRKLHRMIGDAIATRVSAADVRPEAQLLISRPSGRRPYVVRVLPAPATELFLALPAVACVVHIHDLAAVRLPDKWLLRAAFGLTGREADLAVELVRCAGLAAAAERAGMAHNTARNHLQGIFRKCGVATQAELIQLFTRLA